jgi:enoyl-CoA hydratase/carnithine racemase
MTEYSTISLDLTEGVLVLSLDRPGNLNAFTPLMADELEDVFTKLNENDAVESVVLTGSGRAFCAGMDLSGEGNVFGLDNKARLTPDELATRIDDPEIRHGVLDTGGRVVLAMQACLKPIVAAVNGAAIGVGATIILAADARICSANARFGYVFGRIGIVPDACSSWFLPRVVGLPAALDWMLSARIFDADEASAAGLVVDVVGPERLLGAAVSKAHEFSRGRSPVATALTRQMLYRHSGGESAMQAHIIESLALLHVTHRDGMEGVQAFNEKRAARFQSSVATDMPPWWR